MSNTQIGLWRNDPKLREGKYPVLLRRDGSVPEWPWFILGARDPAAPAALRAYAAAFQRWAEQHFGERRCPTCAATLRAVTFPGGMLNRDQWESVKAGDWVCQVCPSNGRSATPGCYWWEREAVRHERLDGALKYVTDIKSLADEFERFPKKRVADDGPPNCGCREAGCPHVNPFATKAIGFGDPDKGPHRKDDPLTLALARGETTMAALRAERDRLAAEKEEAAKNARLWVTLDAAHVQIVDGLKAKLEKAEAEAAALRSALAEVRDDVCVLASGTQEDKDKGWLWEDVARADAALSGTAGAALLARLRAAEGLAEAAKALLPMLDPWRDYGFDAEGFARVSASISALRVAIAAYDAAGKEAGR